MASLGNWLLLLPRANENQKEIQYKIQDCSFILVQTTQPIVNRLPATCSIKTIFRGFCLYARYNISLAE